VGASPWAAINAGFDKAFSAIADSNVTMFMSGGVLFLFGSGPVRGFAVTLMIGIVASMFTALVGSRALIYLIYGRRRRIERLAI
jgi:preprotein translocase subunit SecD